MKVFPSGIKETKERVTVLMCNNAAGTCKFLVAESKHCHPFILKGIRSLPVLYKSINRVILLKK